MNALTFDAFFRRTFASFFARLASSGSISSSGCAPVRLNVLHVQSALGRARARAIAPALALRERFELRHRSPTRRTARARREA